MSINSLSKHDLATRRIWSFVVLVLVVLVMGVLGWFPSNSLTILRPLNGLIGWFAIFCVACQFLKDIMEVDCFLYYNKTDNKPFCYMMFQIICGKLLKSLGLNRKKDGKN